MIPVAAKIKHWREDPNLFVSEQFGVVPDHWQAEALAVFPKDRRICFRASKGPGKSALLAWLIWNFVATRPHAQIAVTSLSKDNLQDGLWKELAKWYAKSTYLQQAFEFGKTRITAKDHPLTWWISARTWSRSADSQQQSNTLSGLHADYLMFVLDEVGAIPNPVMAAAEAGLATGIETKIIMAGNPTHLEGPLYRACTTERHLWRIIEISGDPDDPKRSPRVSAEWAREQIEKYGRDNPWVLVNVFGQFPPSSLNTLLGPDQMSAAMDRHLHETMYSHEAKILGVDPGRFGGARSVIFPRQGLAAFTPVVLRPDRNTKDWTGAFAARIAQAFEKWHADVCFIDDTGGWGAGILDALVAGGYNALGVNFGAKALDRRYANRRCEMLFLAADWVKKGGVLPFDPQLQREATAATYWFRNGVFELEDKEQISERIGESPDLWDSFCLTFAMPVAARTGIDWIDRKTMHAKTEDDEDRQYPVQRALVDEE
ncbi:MAG: hypothetical protein JJE16_13205 [Nitrospiraceae bacterium]|nr:hypothetical protein [Nitrospiraceae bacterium]